MKWLEEMVDNILLDEKTDAYNRILDDTAQVLVGNMINVGRHRSAIIAKSKVAQFSAILDRKTCKLCKYLDGQYFEVGSKEYLKYTPRVHQSCRCIWAYIGKEHHQPKPNFKAPPTELDKLGSLIGEAVSSTVTSLTKATMITKAVKIDSKELKDRADKEFDKFTKTEGKRVYDYTDGAFAAINSSLRKGDIPKTLNKNIKSLDKCFEKVEELDKPIVVSRFGNVNLFGLKENMDTYPLIGKVFKDKAYVSTTINDRPPLVGISNVKDRMLMKITIPKGVKVLPINGKSRFYREEEILLNRDTKFKINKAYLNEDKSMLITECEVISNE